MPCHGIAALCSTQYGHLDIFPAVFLKRLYNAASTFLLLPRRNPLSYNPADGCHSGQAQQSQAAAHSFQNSIPASPPAAGYTVLCPTPFPYLCIQVHETIQSHPKARSRPVQYHESAHGVSLPSSMHKNTSYWSIPHYAEDLRSPYMLLLLTLPPPIRNLRILRFSAPADPARIQGRLRLRSLHQES